MASACRHCRASSCWAPLCRPPARLAQRGGVPSAHAHALRAAPAPACHTASSPSPHPPWAPRAPPGVRAPQLAGVRRVEAPAPGAGDVVRRAGGPPRGGDCGGAEGRRLWHMAGCGARAGGVRARSSWGQEGPGAGGRAGCQRRARRAQACARQAACKASARAWGPHAQHAWPAALTPALAAAADAPHTARPGHRRRAGALRANRQALQGGRGWGAGRGCGGGCTGAQGC